MELPAGLQRRWSNRGVYRPGRWRGPSSCCCSFVTLPEDSGYEASGSVEQDLFDNAGDTVRINVYQRPSSEAERENDALTRRDTVSVTRPLNRGIAVWVRILCTVKVPGWIDDAGIATLQQWGYTVLAAFSFRLSDYQELRPRTSPARVSGPAQCTHGVTSISVLLQRPFCQC